MQLFGHGGLLCGAQWAQGSVDGSRLHPCGRLCRAAPERVLEGDMREAGVYSASERGGLFAEFPLERG